MFKNRPAFPRIFKIILSFGLACTIVLYTYNLRRQLPDQLISHFSGVRSLNWTQIRRQQNDRQNAAYFVDQIGCRMPRFPVFDNDIDKFHFKPTVEACSPVLTQSDDEGAVWVSHNRSVLWRIFGIEDADTLRCQVGTLVSGTDQADQLLLSFGQVVHVDVSFVRVECKFHDADNSTITLPPEYHYFVSAPATQQDAPTTATDNSTKINVLTIGLDSVSRLNFHRQMQRSSAFMLDRLGAVEMFGYNKVGDNTFPNLVPAITGLDVAELKTICLPNTSMYVDGCPFIWDLYKEQGYTTAFAEDMASLRLFYHYPMGFNEQPTDYRLHPLIEDMENHFTISRGSNTYLCLGSHRPIDLLLDYMRKFVRALGTTPYFSLFWSTSYTHDYFNYPQVVDDELADKLNDLHDGMWLNNTFLVLMSDHGLRWGPFRNTYQGMMEDRQPFLFLVPPPWFADQHPEAYLNLLTNRHRLTTHFDLYETYRDLLEPATRLTDAAVLQRSAELLVLEPIPRGISLFLHIPAKRTCTMAAISPHWCTCHEKLKIDQSKPQVQFAARFIVQQINGMVKPFEQCQPLLLNSITDASVGASNVDILVNRTESFSDVTVRLITKPGLGEFEATVRSHDGGRMELTGTVSRTNVYGRQSECVEDELIKLYCFCDSLM